MSTIRRQPDGSVVEVFNARTYETMTSSLSQIADGEMAEEYTSTLCPRCHNAGPPLHQGQSLICAGCKLHMTLNGIELACLVPPRGETT